MILLHDTVVFVTGELSRKFLRIPSNPEMLLKSLTPEGINTEYGATSLLNVVLIRGFKNFIVDQFKQCCICKGNL